MNGKKPVFFYLKKKKSSLDQNAIYREKRVKNTIASDVEKQVATLLKTKGRVSLTIIQVRDKLPVAVLKDLGLTRQSPLTDVVNRLEPWIKKKLKLFKSQGKIYIGFDKPLQEMVFHTIQQTPGLTPKQLQKKLPITNGSLVDCLNKLLEKGKISCKFNAVHIPRFTVPKTNYSAHLKKNGTTPEPEVSLQPMDKKTPCGNNRHAPTERDRIEFKKAYDFVGKGNSFVRIHRIRNHLNWPVKHFDHVLSELIYNYTVQLHGGDTSKLTEEEIENSFVDENRMLYITLTWRRK